MEASNRNPAVSPIQTSAESSLQNARAAVTKWVTIADTQISAHLNCTFVRHLWHNDRNVQTNDEKFNDD